jgi:hypothetical protein
MNALQVYETCGAVAEALEPGPRARFAVSMVGRVVRDVPSTPGLFREIADALPPTVAPLLLPLMRQLRTGGPAGRRAALRWLHDAGWGR